MHTLDESSYKRSLLLVSRILKYCVVGDTVLVAESREGVGTVLGVGRMLDGVLWGRDT